MICAGCSVVGVTRNTASRPGSREQLRVVARSTRCDAERVARPVELLADRAAGGDELGAGHALREVLGVAAAHAAEADDADARSAIACGRRIALGIAAHSSTMRFSRHDVVAASASSSAFTPSSIVVRTGLPLRERVEEMRHLARVRGAIALEEEMLGLVLR